MKFTATALNDGWLNNEADTTEYMKDEILWLIKHNNGTPYYTIDELMTDLPDDYFILEADDIAKINEALKVEIDRYEEEQELEELRAEAEYYELCKERPFMDAYDRYLYFGEVTVA